MKRTLILGAGFGGLTVATELRTRLGDTHEVVLLDRHPSFLVGLRKLWALVGMGTLEEGRRSRASLRARGIPFTEATITRIDPANRRVHTGVGTFDGDFVVLALGAEPRPDLVPGLAEHAHNVYDAAAVPALAADLAAFGGGRIAVVIAGGPYKCPPAPFECIMLLDEHLRERGIRDRTELVVTTFQPLLLPNAGKEGSAWLADRLRDKGIAFHTGRGVRGMARGRVTFADESTLEADMLIGVPPHRPPAVVQDSGLTGEGEWVSVDPATLETTHEGVFAIGDVTHIPLANGLPLPKAGLFAEIQGARVAAAIAADCSGETPPPPFDGQGYCFIEMGKDSAARVEGRFFARPEPEIALGEASERHASDKREFERERLVRWFGA